MFLPTHLALRHNRPLVLEAVVTELIESLVHRTWVCWGKRDSPSAIVLTSYHCSHMPTTEVRSGCILRSTLVGSRCSTMLRSPDSLASERVTPPHLGSVKASSFALALLHTGRRLQDSRHWIFCKGSHKPNFSFPSVVSLLRAITPQLLHPLPRSCVSSSVPFYPSNFFSADTPSPALPFDVCNPAVVALPILLLLPSALPLP